MDAIILAAGYATRLYPLTEKTPKPLLKIAGKPMMEHIIGKLDSIDAIKKIYVITNDKFEKNFNEWLENFDSNKPIEIINDGTSTNDNRLGAVGDINFLIKQKKLGDDVIAIAGDNLFELSLEEVTNKFRKGNNNLIVAYDVKSKNLAKSYGVIKVENSLIVGFQEKPANPESTLVSTGIYIFPRKTIGLIEKYISQGNNADKTGDFIAWLYKREPVHVFVTDKPWYDIGSFEQLEDANKKYKSH